MISSKCLCIKTRFNYIIALTIEPANAAVLQQVQQHYKTNVLNHFPQLIILFLKKEDGECLMFNTKTYQWEPAGTSWYDFNWELLHEKDLPMQFCNYLKYLEIN